MELNEYQKQAMTTCMSSCNNFSYMFLNLVGEVGELASKVAKAIRKERAVVSHNDLGWYGISEEEAADLRKEAGDVLWQLSGLCSTLGWSLEDIARENLDKLASRKERNVIDGDGDNR